MLKFCKNFCFRYRPSNVVSVYLTSGDGEALSEGKILDLSNFYLSFIYINYKFVNLASIYIFYDSLFRFNTTLGVLYILLWLITRG